MNHARRPQIPQLVTRSHPPMREEVQITSPSLQNGTTPDARTTPANDIPPNGFTAVNRESRVTMSFWPDGSARSTVTNIANDDDARQSGAETASAYSNYTPHGWRPDERSLQVLSPQSQPYHASGNMREQAEPPGVRSRDSPRSDDLYHTRMHSPKRRMVSGDPATYTSPDRGSHSGVHSSEALDRERPAAHEADRAKPPSPPLPETEGRLARSLQRSLEPPAQRDLPSHVEHQTRPSLGSAGPEELEMPDPRDGQQSTQYGADSQSSNEPKKRKRNFNNRTKTGCHTCRARKKKCDEGKPICGNCKRGAFECDGYGLKPPGGSKVGGLQPNVAAQAGQHFDQMNGVMPLYRGQSSSRGSTSWQPPKSEAYPPPPHHYGPPSPADYRYGPPPPVDHRTPHFGGSWDARPASGAQFNSSYLSERLQPTHHLSIAPPRTSPGQYQDFRPPSDSWISQNTQSHLPSGPPPNISSRESVQFSQSVKPGGFHLRMVPRSSSLSERTKMLTSQPFKCYTETEIQHDRKSCACAVEAYNNACAASSVTSTYEQARHFLSIIDPSKRIFLETLSHRWSRPSGTTGPRTIVISPFKCDFGYNLHLGEDTLIEAGCSMQDAALITIGDRVIVGPRASFCCITASVDASLRSGSQGRFVAGAIRVEDDVYIGANVTILPFRTIGKGAVVGAGSVVTRDVKPYTIVAGNPAKQIRKRKIESGPYVDRHNDAIQDENDKMQEWMRGYAQSKVPAGKVM